MFLVYVFPLDFLKPHPTIKRNPPKEEDHCIKTIHKANVKYPKESKRGKRFQKKNGIHYRENEGEKERLGEAEHVRRVTAKELHVQRDVSLGQDLTGTLCGGSDIKTLKVLLF